jgi:hypothetical protein
MLRLIWRIESVSSELPDTFLHAEPILLVAQVV